MKKYWLTGLLTAFIFITFSLFYLQDALGKDALPQIELETIAGDETEKDKAIFYGDYHTTNSVESFQLTNEGTIYSSERSFFDQLNGVFPYNSMERLIESHRGFMRGKTHEPNLFFEQEDKIYYVGPYTPSYYGFELDVDILEKANGERKEFAVEIPEEAKGEYVSIMEVQVVDNVLHVFMRVENYGKSTVYLIEIDSETEEITHSIELFKTKENSYMNIANRYDNTGESPYIVFSQEITEWNEVEQFGEVVGMELVAYHVATGEQYAVDLDSSVSNEEEILQQGYTIEENMLYLFHNDQSGVLIEPYNLGDRTLEPSHRIELEAKYTENIFHKYALGDRLYIFSNVPYGNTFERNLFIVHIETGEVLYHGKFNLTEQPENFTFPEFDIYRVGLGEA